MISRLLLGACFTAVAVGLSVPAIVSTHDPIADDGRGQRMAAATATEAGEGIGEAEPAADAGFLGVVVALQSVELSARFDGTLERLDVHVGDRVKAGMPIARLDSRSITRDLAIAEAALRAAEADHERLVIELADAAERRARFDLIAELVSREQLSAAASQEQMAAARLRGSDADLAGRRARTDQLREMLRDAQIVAPFDGTIAARYVEAGTTVSRSAPIVRVIGLTSLVIRFAVPEEQAAAVAIGRQVIVRIASANLTADGVVERITPEVDAALRMVVVEARLAGHGSQAMASGAVARVLFPAELGHHGDGLARLRSPLAAHDGRPGHERSID